MKSMPRNLTPEQASAILAQVPYRDRLRVGRMRWPSGYMPTPVRSLHEVHITLMVDGKSIPAIHLPTLAEWVEKLVGDPDLARAIADCACEESLSYVGQCQELLAVFGERLSYLREIADAPDF